MDLMIISPTPSPSPTPPQTQQDARVGVDVESGGKGVQLLGGREGEVVACVEMEGCAVAEGQSELPLDEGAESVTAAGEQGETAFCCGTAGLR